MSGAANLPQDVWQHHLIPFLDVPSLGKAECVCPQWAAHASQASAWQSKLPQAPSPNTLHAPLAHAQSGVPIATQVAAAKSALAGVRQASAAQLVKWMACLPAAQHTARQGQPKQECIVRYAFDTVRARLNSGMAVRRTDSGCAGGTDQIPQHTQPPPGADLAPSVVIEHELRFMSPAAAWLRWGLDWCQHTLLLLVPPSGLVVFFALLGARMDGYISLSYLSIFSILVGITSVVVLVGILAIATRVLTEQARRALYRAGLLVSKQHGSTALPAYNAAASWAAACASEGRAPLTLRQLRWHLAWLPNGDVERRFTLWGMAMWWLIRCVQQPKQHLVWALAASTVTLFFASPIALALKATGVWVDLPLGWRTAMLPALLVLLATLLWPNVIGMTYGTIPAYLRFGYNLVCCPLALPLVATLTLWALRLDGMDVSLEAVFLPVWLSAGALTATALIGAIAAACASGTCTRQAKTAPPALHTARTSPTPTRQPSTLRNRGASSAFSAKAPRHTRSADDTSSASLLVYPAVAGALLCCLLVAALLLLYFKVAADEAGAEAARAGRAIPHANRSARWWTSWSFAIAPTWALSLAVLAAAVIIRRRVLHAQARWVATHAERWQERLAFGKATRAA